MSARSLLLSQVLPPLTTPDLVEVLPDQTWIIDTIGYVFMRVSLYLDSDDGFPSTSRRGVLEDGTPIIQFTFPGDVNCGSQRSPIVYFSLTLFIIPLSRGIGVDFTLESKSRSSGRTLRSVSSCRHISLSEDTVFTLRTAIIDSICLLLEDEMISYRDAIDNARRYIQRAMPSYLMDSSDIVSHATVTQHRTMWLSHISPDDTIQHLGLSEEVDMIGYTL